LPANWAEGWGYLPSSRTPLILSLLYGEHVDQRRDKP
jgi:hypothetical protein